MAIVRGRVMMTMFRSHGSCHLSLCKLPILPHGVTTKVTLNVTLPLWRTTLGQVYNWLPERVYCILCCWTGLGARARVVSIWELAHDWAQHTPGLHSTLPGVPRTPELRTLQLYAARLAHHPAPLHPSLGWDLAFRSPKLCYSFPRARLVIVLPTSKLLDQRVSLKIWKCFMSWLKPELWQCQSVNLTRSRIRQSYSWLQA